MMRKIVARTPALLIGGYSVLLLIKSATAAKWIPVRSYDMFAAPVPAGNPRSLVVLHLRDGRLAVVPPFHLLPFEAMRCTSIIVETLRSGGVDGFARLMRTSLRLQARGWRRFDQVWGPLPGIGPEDIVAACFHRVPRDQVRRLGRMKHGRCPTKVDLSWREHLDGA